MLQPNIFHIIFIIFGLLYVYCQQKSTIIISPPNPQTELALRFELTGGFIKNAILSALSIAVSRDGDAPIVEQKDLLQGANLQLRGRLRMKVSYDI